MNLPELGAFLRTRRDRIRPAEVGLPQGPRRRVPGLRREEVAQLAGLSVDYYTELERGSTKNGVQPSAQTLAARTIDALSFGIVPASVSVPVLAAWECCIGLGLLSGVMTRAILLLLFVHMAGTITPLFLFPDEAFHRFPYAPTLEGQYIIKNVVLISAGIVVGATVRGGDLVADPIPRRRSASWNASIAI